MLPRNRTWWADPLVAIGACTAVVLHAWVWFAAEYLPYIDYANHLGLISIFAHGAETGALAYADRSIAPVPYLLFYLTSAGFAQVMSVPAAMKASLLVATALCTYSAAFLAHSAGRSPRLGLAAPLMLFGYSLGYGFMPYVFTLPFLLLALGCTELLLEAVAVAAPWRGRFVALAAAIGLVYLGHALLFCVCALLIASRATIWLLARLITRPRQGGRGWLLVALSSLPTILIGGPVLVLRMSQAGAGQTPSSNKAWMSFESLDHRYSRLGGHLLERGSEAHWTTMYAACGVLIVWLLCSVVRAHPSENPNYKRGTYGLEVYVLVALGLYFFGPLTLHQPMEAWGLYPRFAVVAAGLVFLLPRTDLRGRLGLPAALLALGLLAHNAYINHGHMTRFNAVASAYDAVRALIPPRSRVLALSLAREDNLIRQYQALGSLYFYHLADGAAYVPYLFDVPLLPVRPKTAQRPRAPPWRRVRSFNPSTHGRDYDYLVLRGEALSGRARTSPHHVRIGTSGAWTVYKTLVPPPKRSD